MSEKPASIRIIFSVLVLFFTSNSLLTAQITANSGGDNHFCTYPDSLNHLIIGGTPTAQGGFPPYEYEWTINPIELYQGANIILTAADILDDTTKANPEIVDFTLTDSLEFYLKVTDSLGNEAFDTCLITISAFVKFLFYHTYYIDKGDSVFLDKGVNIHRLFNNENISYNWQPNEGLSHTNLSNNFWASPDTTIWYYVKITDQFGCEAQGDPFYNINVLPLSVKPSNIWSDFKIFPNPLIDNQLNIQSDENIFMKSISIYDLSGKQVFTQNINSLENNLNLTLPNLPSAMYIVQIDTEKGLVNKKINVLK